MHMTAVARRCGRRAEWAGSPRTACQRIRCGCGNGAHQDGGLSGGGCGPRGSAHTRAARRQGRRLPHGLEDRDLDARRSGREDRRRGGGGGRGQVARAAGAQSSLEGGELIDGREGAALPVGEEEGGLDGDVEVRWGAGGGVVIKCEEGGRGRELRELRGVEESGRDGGRRAVELAGVLDAVGFTRDERLRGARRWDGVLHSRDV